jgi:signal transduction histidine kinase
VSDPDPIERHLREARQMDALGRVIRTIAHDFNNVLAAILGTADLLALRLQGEDDRRDAEEVRKAAERGVALTRRLAAFTRRDERPAESLDVNVSVGAIAAALQQIAGDRISVRVRGSGGPARVRIAPGLLHDVVMHLVANARDAMPGGGSIDVDVAAVEVSEDEAERSTALAPGRYVRLSVRDTGTGIDPAAQPRVLEPFFTTKDPAQHAGLGLCVVWSIVRDAGGTLAFATTPGSGTDVEIMLPVDATRM